MASPRMDYKQSHGPKSPKIEPKLLSRTVASFAADGREWAGDSETAFMNTGAFRSRTPLFPPFPPGAVSLAPLRGSTSLVHDLSGHVTSKHLRPRTRRTSLFQLAASQAAEHRGLALAAHFAVFQTSLNQELVDFSPRTGATGDPPTPLSPSAKPGQRGEAPEFVKPCFRLAGFRLGFCSRASQGSTKALFEVV